MYADVDGESWSLHHLPVPLQHFFLASLGTQPYSLGLMAEGDIKSQCCIHVWYFANIYSSWFGTMAGVKWAVVAPEDVQSGLCKIFFQKVSLWVSCMSCMVFIIWGLRGFSVPHLDLHSRFLFVQTHDMHACMRTAFLLVIPVVVFMHDHAWTCMNRNWLKFFTVCAGGTLWAGCCFGHGLGQRWGDQSHGPETLHCGSVQQHKVEAK